MYYSTLALKALHIFGTLGTSFSTVRVVCKYSVPGVLYKGVTVKLLPISTTENTDNVPKIPGLLIILTYIVTLYIMDPFARKM